MARPVGESVLRALVNEASEEAGAPRILAIAAAPRWSGKSVLETEVGTVRVLPCVSPLAVRDALSHRDRAEDGEVLVILTDRDEHELGQEVMARVWRHRLVRPSAWEAVKGQFRVDRLDPALSGSPLACRPPGGGGATARVPTTTERIPGLRDSLAHVLAAWPAAGRGDAHARGSAPVGPD